MWLCVTCLVFKLSNHSVHHFKNHAIKISIFNVIFMLHSQASLCSLHKIKQCVGKQTLGCVHSRQKKTNDPVFLFTSKVFIFLCANIYIKKVKKSDAVKLIFLLHYICCYAVITVQVIKKTCLVSTTRMERGRHCISATALTYLLHSNMLHTVMLYMLIHFGRTWFKIITRLNGLIKDECKVNLSHILQNLNKIDY